MFIVISDIVSEDVQNPIVGICFGDRYVPGHFPIGKGRFGKDIMLGNKMGGTRMERTGQKGTQNEIHQRLGPQELDNQHVEGNLSGNVAKVDRPKWDAIDEHGSNGIE